ncbi:MAG: hypothetical protein ACRDDW_07590 [Candidatus Rhabdochlamydia sp.]
MLGAINFNPVQAVNSLLNPLGLTLSTKQQIISKIAFASFAMLAINNVLQNINVNADDCHCRYETKCLWAIKKHCYQECERPETQDIITNDSDYT